MKKTIHIILVLFCVACKKQKTIEHLPVSCDVSDKVGVYVGTFRYHYVGTPGPYSYTVQDTVVVATATGETCVVSFSKYISSPRFVLPSGATSQKTGTYNGSASFKDDTLHYIHTDYYDNGYTLHSEAEFTGQKL